MTSRLYTFITSFVLLFLFLGSGCSSDENSHLNHEIDASELQGHIRWLADPALEGRLAGSINEARAANYIADNFRNFGLEPGGDGDTFFQMFTLNGPMTEAMGKNEHLSRNVITVIPGHTETDRYVIVGAHYDGQGMGGVISLDGNNEPVIHPSADDNASGTAGLLELAHYFSEIRSNRTLVFIAFSGEELGLLGSRYFVANSTLPEGEILAMVNLDMIGRMEGDELSIIGTGTADAWPDLINNANIDSLNISIVSSGSGASDHTSFYEQEIPVLHYFTGTHSDYHRPGDTAGKINVEGIEKVVKHVQRVISQLDTITVSKLEFQPAGQGQQDEVRFEGPTLGVLPDYTYDGVGLRLESVRSGYPGDRAGMKNGDIIIELDGTMINDIFDYMDLIGKYEQGDNTSILILRNGEEIVLEVVF